MRRTGTALGAVMLVAAVGCSGSSIEGDGPRGPRPSAESCPEATGADGSAAAIDYVDFIQAFGRQYLSGVSKHPSTATRGQLGRVVLRSKCSFSALNDRTHKSPGEPHDGDTGFLPPGTPIYALHGWPTGCRLAAEQDGRLHVYLAYRDDPKVATPRRCAVRQVGNAE